MYKFMQIYGNCAGLFFLGENRIKGPVDNVITKNWKTIEVLVSNKYLDYIKNALFTQSARVANFDGDSEIAYDATLVQILHNNPGSDRYINHLEERCNSLKDFLAEVKTNKEYYLIYCLNNFDLNRGNHRLHNNHLLDNIKYLQKLDLLDKTIFVGNIKTKTSNPVWNYWSNDLIEIIKKYNLKYLEIQGIKIVKDTTKADLANFHAQFITQFIAALKNGTDKKYLKKRNLDGSYSKEQENPEKKSTYLYF